MKLLRSNINNSNNSIVTKNGLGDAKLKLRTNDDAGMHKPADLSLRNYRKIIKSNGVNYIDRIKYFALFSILFMANYALGDDVFATKFCSLTGIVKGPLGMAICVVLLIGLFLAVLFGKIDFRTFILTALGVLSIFYAQEVIAFITQNDSYKKCKQPEIQQITQPS